MTGAIIWVLISDILIKQNNEHLMAVTQKKPAGLVFYNSNSYKYEAALVVVLVKVWIINN